MLSIFVHVIVYVYQDFEWKHQWENANDKSAHFQILPDRTNTTNNNNNKRVSVKTTQQVKVHSIHIWYTSD